MKIIRKNNLTGKENTMELDITQEQLDEINQPGHLRRNMQEIVPDLSPEEREFLISGITPEEWEEIFK